jgi:hypothetical protein
MMRKIDMGQFYDKNKELIDQTAHLVVGHLFTFAMMIALSWIWSFLIMITCAIIREFIQHRKKLWSFVSGFPHAEFPLGEGSMIDLVFFMVGGVSALLWHWSV